MTTRSLPLLLLAALALALAACDLTPTIPPIPPADATSTAIARSVTTIIVAPPSTPIPTETRQPTSISSPVVVETPTQAAIETVPAVAAATNTVPPPTAASQGGCAPTSEDGEGPFYVPGAPVRSSVGTGHILSGVVKSSRDCTPIANARIEFWQVNSNGEYDDAHRATMLSDNSGAYRFESNFPPGYQGRPPHIHVKVFAEGHRTLTTQFYPQQGQTEATFDLVLVLQGQ